MKRIPGSLAFGAACAVIAMAALGGCSKTSTAKVVATHQAGDIAITLLSDTGDLNPGDKEFSIEFKSSSNGGPVDVGRVLISAMMPMPGMAPMSADVDVSPTDETGRYRATSNFSMAGTWRLSIQWDGPAGRGSSTLSQSVR